jgi:hypothetical protein
MSTRPSLIAKFRGVDGPKLPKHGAMLCLRNPLVRST